jgi:cell division protein FtsB
MSSSFSHTSGVTKFILIIEFVLVSYLLYSLTKNVYNSYRVDRYIETFRAENATIEEENRQKTENYLYFTSEEYIDKIAKQNFGLVNPGEEVIILSADILDDDVFVEEDYTGDFARQAGMSNTQQWRNFFFGD